MGKLQATKLVILKGKFIQFWLERRTFRLLLRYICLVLVPSSGCREFLSHARKCMGEKFFFPRSPTASFLQRLVFLLAACSVYDQATWPPRPVSAISKPSPFFTKGFAVQAGMADLAIMEVAGELKIYIRNCYVVLRTIGRLNGGPSSLPSGLLLCLAWF